MNYVPYPSHWAFPRRGPLPDRLLSLLLDNTPPSPAEHEALVGIVKSSPSIIAALDEEISDLTTQKELISIYFHRARRIIHPMRTLPVDILCEIFLCCIDAEYTRGGSSLDPRRAPWTLSHVCRQWRNVALSFPKLWSTLQINFLASSQGPLPCAISRLGLWLSRVGDYSLDVELVSTNYPAGQDALLYRMLPSRKLWRSLKISLYHQDYAFLSQGIPDFRRLQSLHVALHSNRVPINEGSPPIQVFASATSLRTLVAYNKEEWWPADVFGLPWTRITDLSVIFGPYIYIRRLAELPNLKNLTLGCNSVHASFSAPVVLPSVVTLTLKEHRHQSGTAAEAFSQMSLPGLRELYLMYEQKSNHSDTISGPIIFPDVSTTGRMLELVEIACRVEDDNLNGDTLRLFFSSLPSVRTLHLRIWHLPFEVLGMLVCTTEGSDITLLPNLECINVGGSAAPHTPFEALIVVIMSRRAGVSREIRQVKLSQRMRKARDEVCVVEQWRELMGEGLEVIVDPCMHVQRCVIQQHI